MINRTVKILNWNDYYRRGGRFAEVQNIFLSPDETLAVVVCLGQETFVAVRILEQTPEGYVAEFFDEFRCSRDDCDFRICRVDWSWMKYGFCKLSWTDMERGSSCVHRFYFDRELYEQKRAELNGLSF